MRKEILYIVEDKKSGSLQILLNLIEYCRVNFSNDNELKSVCEISQKKLFHFAAIRNFISQLEKKISNSNSEELLAFLIDYQSKLKNISNTIYFKNKQLFLNVDSFTTLSFSKTLLDIIKIRMKDNKKLSAFVLESRPILEGRKFISELSRLNVNSTLIIDSSMCYAVQKSDAVFIGADQILKNGNVVNKIGSYPLALCAKEFNKPFYVIADKSKYVTKSKFIPKDYSESEVWKTQKKIKIFNQYFEEIPAKFITKILSD